MNLLYPQEPTATQEVLNECYNDLEILTLAKRRLEDQLIDLNEEITEKVQEIDRLEGGLL